MQGLIGGTPQACLFQFAFCLILYNLIQVIRAYVAEVQQREIEELSSEKMFDDVKRELIAWNVMLDVETTVTTFCTLPDAETLRKRLETLLRPPGATRGWHRRSPRNLAANGRLRTNARMSQSTVSSRNRRRKRRAVNSS